MLSRRAVKVEIEAESIRMDTMSKAELVKIVQNHLGEQVSLAQAERTVAAVIEGIKRGVSETGRLRLLGFGTLKIVALKARTG